MNDKITVFIEYKVNSDRVGQYEKYMKKVLAALKKDGVSTPVWMKAIDQDFLYVECFDVSDPQAYISIKEKRLSTDHSVYGALEQMISGGLSKLHCWAFQKKGEEAF
ncbi:hypothetical protein SAMN04488137_4089 [Fictibacillus solisalsi]|uniref:Transmembrane secretion effector n=1 Tax=Fictibacillus solisalsi TaxID=459525 RepID=A0A1H0AFD9_9BACL|nr:hypothetical protein [Fictibacillus solisalsi]SDN32125.1 hypothetical protein SAMN04488137_4089 [Fictibacillus solisalsi]